MSRSRHIPGHQYSGAPSSHLSSSSAVPLHQRLRPNTHGLTAREREQQLIGYTSSRDKKALEDELRGRRNDWDVVRDHHQFIRDDIQDTKEGAASGSGSGRGWEENVARAYESKLFKEFAMIDLKHYKSKKFALRWRTAPEVINGLGEDTCGSLRCKNHHPSSSSSSSSRQTAIAFDNDNDDDDDDDEGEGGAKERVSLNSFELPFVYSEWGQRKEALVKVRLCPRCQKKLLWKPSPGDGDAHTENRQRDHHGDKSTEGQRGSSEKNPRRRSTDDEGLEESYRRDKNRRRSQSRSRSRSPTRKRKSHRHDRY